MFKDIVTGYELDPRDILAIEAEARAQGALHAHLVNEGDIEQARADAINELEAKTVKHFLAIADEARAAVLRELREEVEGMNLKASWVLRAAVLAAIDRRLP